MVRPERPCRQQERHVLNSETPARVAPTGQTQGELAVRLLEYGGQLVLNDVPTPTIARDEILVKTKSTAVNHLDLVELALSTSWPCPWG
jgi:hypothetical protein